MNLAVGSCQERLSYFEHCILDGHRDRG